MSKYVVYQGIISKSGDGSMYVQYVTIDFKQALDFANSIKDSINGWVGKGNLVTEIIDESNDHSVEWQYTLNR